jgi:hypothetical protein
MSVETFQIFLHFKSRLHLELTGHCKNYNLPIPPKTLILYMETSIFVETFESLNALNHGFTSDSRDTVGSTSEIPAAPKTLT